LNCWKFKPRAAIAAPAPFASSSVFDSAEVSLILAADTVSSETPETFAAVERLATASAVSPIFSAKSW